jgi:repressor LexA
MSSDFFDMTNLSQKQKEVLDYLKEYYKKNGYTPTMNEVATNFSVSIPAIQNRYKELIYKGYISKPMNKSRSITFKDEDEKNLTVSIPVAGEIKSGQSILYFPEQDIKNVEVLNQWIDSKDKNDYIALKIKGFGFIEEGFSDADIVTILKKDWAEEGQVIVGECVNNQMEVFIKRFFIANDSMELKSLNPFIKSIKKNKDEIRIKGIVVGLIRNLNR